MFQALCFSHSCFCVMHTIVSILMLKYIVYCLQVLDNNSMYLENCPHPTLVLAVKKFAEGVGPREAPKNREPSLN